jgi:hypothetical protein
LGTSCSSQHATSYIHPDSTVLANRLRPGQATTTIALRL